MLFFNFLKNSEDNTIIAGEKNEDFAVIILPLTSLVENTNFTTVKEIFEKKERGPKTQKKKDIPDGLWEQCPSCGETIYQKQLDENLWVCPHCDYHFKINGAKYREILLDKDSFQIMDEDVFPIDPLEFVDSKPYPVRLKQATEKSKVSEAITVGLGTIEEIPISCGFMDFKFIGGSMGSVVGERVTRAAERAAEKHIPLVLVNASGGARMQESIISLMQMAKTSAALNLVRDAELPYISILTNPTMAGVMASYASLGDIVIAEPSALLGFAGPRVIEQTIGKKLPPGFQSSEFFLEHGFLDTVVHRRRLKHTTALLLKHLYKKK